MVPNLGFGRSNRPASRPDDGRITSGIYSPQVGYVAEYREWFSLEDAVGFLAPKRAYRATEATRWGNGAGRYVVMQSGVVLWSA